MSDDESTSVGSITRRNRASRKAALPSQARGTATPTNRKSGGGASATSPTHQPQAHDTPSRIPPPSLLRQPSAGSIGSRPSSSMTMASPARPATSTSAPGAGVSGIPLPRAKSMATTNGVSSSPSPQRKKPAGGAYDDPLELPSTASYAPSSSSSSSRYSSNNNNNVSNVLSAADARVGALQARMKELEDRHGMAGNGNGSNGNISPSSSSTSTPNGATRGRLASNADSSVDVARRFDDDPTEALLQKNEARERRRADEAAARTRLANVPATSPTTQRQQLLAMSAESDPNSRAAIIAQMLGEVESTPTPSTSTKRESNIASAAARPSSTTPSVSTNGNGSVKKTTGAAPAPVLVSSLKKTPTSMQPPVVTRQPQRHDDEEEDDEGEGDEGDDEGDEEGDEGDEDDEEEESKAPVVTTSKSKIPVAGRSSIPSPAGSSSLAAAAAAAKQLSQKRVPTPTNNNNATNLSPTNVPPALPTTRPPSLPSSSSPSASSSPFPSTVAAPSSLSSGQHHRGSSSIDGYNSNGRGSVFDGDDDYNNRSRSESKTSNTSGTGTPLMAPATYDIARDMEAAEAKRRRQQDKIAEELRSADRRRKLEERSRRDRQEKEQRQRELRAREDAAEREALVAVIARQRQLTAAADEQRRQEAERLAIEHQRDEETKRKAEYEARQKKEQEEEDARVLAAAKLAEQQQRAAMEMMRAAEKKEADAAAARERELHQQQTAAMAASMAAMPATTAATVSNGEHKDVPLAITVTPSDGATGTTATATTIAAATGAEELPGGVSPLMVGPALSVDTLPATRGTSLSTMGLMLSPSHSPVADLATLAMGTQFWKVPKRGPAKKKTFRVQKHPSGDYLVKWDSKKKSDDQAVFMLSRDTIIHIGLKEGRFKTERAKVSKIEDAANRSLTLDNGQGKHGRTLDLVACNATDFNHWVRVLNNYFDYLRKQPL